MRILFLHGLESELSEAKRAHLLTYGEVLAPSLDYRSDSDMTRTLADRYAGESIDVIIGSSMGGFAGYYLSLLLQTPCLLFNPALPYRSVEHLIPDASPPGSHYLQVALGKQDEVIKAADTLAFLTTALPPAANARIHLIQLLSHRIPLPIFKQEIDFFFHLLAGVKSGNL